MSLERSFTKASPEREEMEDLESEYPESLAVQSKIIKALNTGKPAGEEIPIISEEERQEFLRRLSHNEIPKDKINYILGGENPKNKSMDDSLDSYVAIKEKLQSDDTLRILLNILLSRSPENFFSVPQVMAILDSYPQPNDFEKLADNVLKKFAQKDGRDSRKNIRALARILYGGKQDIWEQFKLLKQEAEYIYGKTFEEGSIRIQRLRLAESREVLSRVEVHGDPWEGVFLKPKDLEARGLGPQLKVEVDGKNIWFSSSSYRQDNGYLAVVGYVEDKDGKLVARTFYRSNSHGIWKYMPRYRLSDNRIDWFDKGYGQESISLPIPFQRALAYITKEQPIPIYVEDPNFVFAGCARNIIPPNTGVHAITYQAEVKEKALVLNGAFYPDRHDRKVSPRTADFIDGEQAPNFSKIVYRWEQDTDIYGAIEIEVFTSKDKKYRYMFCQDKLGRVWIGGVERNSDIGSTGLREYWVDAGDLTTPAYERVSESGGYGNYDLQSSHYVDMFKNYLSKIPVIKKYLESKKRRS